MKQRLIGAGLVLLVTIPAFIIGGSVWAWLVGLTSLVAYREIITIFSKELHIPNLVKYIGVFNMLLLVFSHLGGYSLAFGMSYVALALTFVSMLVPTLFVKNYKTTSALLLGGILVFLGTVFNSLILFENMNNLLIIYLVLLATMTDTFAMVIGSLIGRRKIVKEIPDKTIEGAIGGLIAGVSIASIFYINVIDNSDIVSTILITLVLGVFAVLGDLIFSKIKKDNNITKFSKLIPGHGGILDQLDSIIITVLVYIIIMGV